MAKATGGASPEISLYLELIPRWLVCTEALYPYSIHDITSVNDGDTSTPQGPITGQGIGSTGAVGKPAKSLSQPSLPRVVTYGSSVGQPIAGPGGSAVVTPIMIPPGHVPYVSRGPLPGPVVPGTPMNVVPVAYPVSQPTMHQ